MIEEQNIHQLPKGWKRVKLGEVANYLNGRAFKPTEWKDSGTPIIRIQNLNKPNAKYNYTKEDFEDRYKVEKGDLLFAWSASLGAYIWNGNNAWLNQHIFKVVPKEVTDKKYLFHLLEKIVQELYAKAHGSGMVHVTKSKFESTYIPFPPKPIQQAIVSKIEELFSELDKGIEQLKTAQQQLKTYRQAVLKWAFEGRLTNENVKDGELPEGWEYANLKELKLFSIYGPRFSSKDYAENGIAVLRTTDISETGKVDWENSPKLSLSDSEYEKYKLIKNDLLITRTGSIGRLSIFNDSKKAIPGAFLIHYRLRDDLNIWYIFHFLKSHRAQKHFAEYSSGVGRPNLNVPNIELLQIPLPQIEEQNKIVQEIESRLSVADKMEESINQSLQQAEALRQSILKKAFEGTLVKTKEQQAYKPSNEYFFDCQILAFILRASKKRNIKQGEMTLAKYAYLAVKIFGIPLSYVFQQWHLGPYAPEMKKAVNNKQFFTNDKSGLGLADEKKIMKYTNPFQEKTEDAVNELISIFEKYKSDERSHKTELLATVCKAIEDAKSTDLNTIRNVMVNWKIDLKKSPYKNKAEKFTEKETDQCIKFIVNNGWDLKLI